MMRELCHSQLEYMKRIRRHIHQNPELSGKEFKTCALVQEELEKMGIEYEVVAETGVVGIIRGEKPGKTILLRADMDALAIQENTGCEFASQVPGVMHACAHDGHTAALLGTAKVLSGVKDKIAGTVKLVFQPSEEYDFGGRTMVQAGVLENPHVDFALSHHLWGPVPKGMVGVRPKGFMAAPDVVGFAIRGSGGHGATPDVCTDTIQLTCQAINMIYSRLQRKMNVFDEAVLSLCSINGGDSYNVLPNEVRVLGTLRTFDVNVRKKALAIVEDVLKAVTSMEGAEYEMLVDIDNGPVVNDPKLTEIVRASAVEILGEEHVLDLEFPELGGEDFAYFSEKVPSCYFFVGLSEDMSNPVVHHNPDFQWDDDLLETSCCAMVQSTLNILEHYSK